MNYNLMSKKLDQSKEHIAKLLILIEEAKNNADLQWQIRTEMFQIKELVYPVLEFIDKYQAIVKQRQPLNLNALNLKIKIFSTVNQQLTSYLEMFQDNAINQDALLTNLIINKSLMEEGKNFLEEFQYLNQDDLLFLPKTHKRWKELKPYYEFAEIADPEVVKRSYMELATKMSISSATL